MKLNKVLNCFNASVKKRMIKRLLTTVYSKKKSAEIYRQKCEEDIAFSKSKLIEF